MMCDILSFFLGKHKLLLGPSHMLVAHFVFVFNVSSKTCSLSHSLECMLRDHLTKSLSEILGIWGISLLLSRGTVLKNCFHHFVRVLQLSADRNLFPWKQISIVREFQDTHLEHQFILLEHQFMRPKTSRCFKSSKGLCFPVKVFKKVSLIHPSSSHPSKRVGMVTIEVEWGYNWGWVTLNEFSIFISLKLNCNLKI